MNEFKDKTGEERKAATESFKAAIVADVKAKDWYSFWNVKDFAESHGFPVKGDYIVGPIDYNVAFWVGMSDELSEVIADLVRDKKLFYHAADILTYLVDGGMPTLPRITARMPKNGYKELHWLPVCLRVVPTK